MSQYPYYKTAKLNPVILPPCLSFSQKDSLPVLRANSPPPYTLDDLSDSEFEELRKSIASELDSDVTPCSTPKPVFKPLDTVDPPVLNLDTNKLKTYDGKRLGYTILFTIFTFIVFIIIPGLSLAPRLLRTLLGEHLSMIILLAVSTASGYQIASNRHSLLLKYRQVEGHRSFYSTRSLILTCIGLYAVMYLRDWIFMGVFRVYSIQIIGPILVLAVFTWTSIIYAVVVVGMMASLSWSLVSKSFK